MSSSELSRSGEGEEEESKHYVIEISFDEVDDDQLQKTNTKTMTNTKKKTRRTIPFRKHPKKVTDEDVGEPIVLVVEWRDLEGNDGESNQKPFESISISLFSQIKKPCESNQTPCLKSNLNFIILSNGKPC